MSLMNKFPDGKIPQSQINQFYKDRKIQKFKEYSKKDLFLIVFRDKNFMKALDNQIEYRDTFKKNQKEFLPTIEQK